MCRFHDIIWDLGWTMHEEKVEVMDHASTDLCHHFKACVRFITDANAKGGKTLVHCFQGKSRSVSVACAYLMITSEGMVGFQEALEIVRRARPVAEPNLGFAAQLRTLEKTLQAQSV
ncbi:unnamed protein product [Choristocarpus tenellus]